MFILIIFIIVITFCFIEIPKANLYIEFLKGYLKDYFKQKKYLSKNQKITLEEDDDGTLYFYISNKKIKTNCKKDYPSKKNLYINKEYYKIVEKEDNVTTFEDTEGM